MSVNTTELRPRHLVTKLSDGTLHHCSSLPQALRVRTVWRHQTPGRALHKAPRNGGHEVAYHLLDLCHKAVQKEKHIL